MAEVEAEVKAGRIRPVQPVHLFINILSLCLFPFIAKPMMHAMLGISEPAYQTFISERKKVVTETIINSVRKSKK